MKDEEKINREKCYQFLADDQQEEATQAMMDGRTEGDEKRSESSNETNQFEWKNVCRKQRCCC